MKWISGSLLFLVLMLGTASLSAQNVVYRWTDENGKVHYTPTLPAQAANLPHDVLSPQGILLRRVDPNAEEEVVEVDDEDNENDIVPIYSEAEKKRISDRLLLVRYRNEGEIDEAMTQEIDQLAYDFRILESTNKSATKSLADQVRLAANRQRAGLEPEEVSLQQIAQLQQRLRNNQSERDRLNSREQQIRLKFAAEKERYRALVTPTEDASESDATEGAEAGTGSAEPANQP